MKIITTVGTSLITNSELDLGSLETLTFNLDLFTGSHEEDKNTRDRISSIEKNLLQYLTYGITCAEISTLKNISKPDDVKVILLCTETILSYMCGRVIKEFLDQNVTVEYIPGLQIKDADKFKNEGFFNLLKRIREIKYENLNDPVLLNISGGYKALIPPVTLLAQLERMPLYYIYEDSEELIETGTMPINFDWSVIEDLVQFLHNKNKRNDQRFSSEVDRMRELRLVEKSSNDLTIIGQMLAEYSKNASPFTATIFGYLIEHKLYEMYAGKFGSENVMHSVKPANGGSEDIDLLIKQTADFITIEIKPSYRLDEMEYMNKTIENMITRAKGAVDEKKYGTIKEIWLMLYSYSSDRQQVYSINNDNQKQLEIYGGQINREFGDGVAFKVWHTFIHSNNLSSERHIYQKFMKEKIKYENVKQIYPLNSN